MRLLVLLPYPWQFRLGKLVGRLAHALIPSRRHVVDCNLRTCFPELSDEDRKELEIRHFEAVGASMFEMAMGWFGSLKKIEKRVEISGLEYLEEALQHGHGVILYSAHFTPFEFFFPVLAPLCPRVCGMYKEQRNPIMNKIMTRGRLRSVARLFSKENVRSMVKELGKNSVVWYASDQRYAGKGGELVPFFGEPALTNTAISRIAHISGATVLPYFCRRNEDGSRYQATILGPLPDFPSDDPIADAERLGRCLEDYIRTCPEQYWWIHKRFKGRPAPYPDIYRRRA